VVPDLRRRAGASLPSREGALGHPGSPVHLVGRSDRILPRTGYLVTYLYERLPGWDVPLPALAACFVWGGTIGTLIAGTLEYDLLLSMGLVPLLGIGLIEEGAKLIFPLLFYFLGRYRSEADGIILGVSTAMGFAALETMGYSFVAFLESRGNLGYLNEVLLVRGLTSPAGHGAWTGLVCAVLFRERLKAGHAVLN
jgi:protease PrsW